MSIPCIVIATICYLITAVSCGKQKDYGHMWMWLGYVLANLGLLWYEWSKR